jgi:hypothetical protein
VLIKDASCYGLYAHAVALMTAGLIPHRKMILSTFSRVTVSQRSRLCMSRTGVPLVW